MLPGDLFVLFWYFQFVLHYAIAVGRTVYFTYVITHESGAIIALMIVLFLQLSTVYLHLFAYSFTDGMAPIRPLTTYMHVLHIHMLILDLTLMHIIIRDEPLYYLFDCLWTCASLALTDSLPPQPVYNTNHVNTADTHTPFGLRNPNTVATDTNMCAEEMCMICQQSDISARTAAYFACGRHLAHRTCWTAYYAVHHNGRDLCPMRCAPRKVGL